MKLNVNAQSHDITATVLSDALIELGYKDAKIATALNEVFIPAALRKTTPLNDGDRLEIVAPMQGG
ncbi:MAG: thiamine biosynthesis protein ThiS [Rhodobacteraceae bacterium]|nr:MAG: thiamine biosynthesis protein ThiS [Paracoccaceae bacterium]